MHATTALGAVVIVALFVGWLHVNKSDGDLKNIFTTRPSHADYVFDYAAISEITGYIKRQPKDVFGYNFLGYLYLCKKSYQQAIDIFQKGLRLQPDNPYAYCKSSRCYGSLYLEASNKSQRKRYRKLAVEMLAKARHSPSVDHRRIE